jgi:hypothetical protein
MSRDRATAAALHTIAGRRRLWETEHGYTVGRPHPCPWHRLTGKHSPDRYTCCWGGARLHVMDHDYGVIETATGLRGVLTQPYGFSSRDAHQLDALCAATGADWYCVGPGWWNPAGTVAVVILTTEALR